MQALKAVDESGQGLEPGLDSVLGEWNGALGLEQRAFLAEITVQSKDPINGIIL